MRCGAEPGGSASYVKRARRYNFVMTRPESPGPRRLDAISPSPLNGERIPRKQDSRIEPLNRPAWVGRGVLTAPRSRRYFFAIRGGLRTARPPLRFMER